MTSRAQERALPFLVAVLATLPYLPSLSGEFLNYDDNYLVVESRAIQEGRVAAILDPAGSRLELGSEYLPVRDLSYALDAWLYGTQEPGGNRLGPMAPFGFRLTNLLWYALGCGLATAFLLTLLDPLRRGGRPRNLAVLSGLLFALHPAHAESVAWVAGRKDVISTALVFLALLLHLRARRSGAGAFYAASAVVAGLACLAKSTATALPLLVATIELLVRDGARPWPRRLLRVLPTLAVCSVAAGLAVWVGGRTGVGRGLALAELPARLLLVDPVVLRRYLVLAFVPLQLRVNHHDLVSVVLEPGTTRVLHALAAGVGCLVPLVWLALRSRRRLVWFAGLWFLAGLLPVLNLIPFSQLVADRFLCVPLLGASLVLGWLLLGLRAARPRAGSVALAALLILWGGLAVQRGLEFKTSVALWEANLRVEPNDPLTLRHLGDVYLTAGRTSDGIEALERSLQAFSASGRVTNPGHHLQAYLLLARTLERAADRARARGLLQEAVQRFPRAPDPICALAEQAYRARDYETALAGFRQAEALLPRAAISVELRAYWAWRIAHNAKLTEKQLRRRRGR